MNPNASSSSRLVLLAVLAHPDDESFGMGGTLALYAKRGVEVHLVCATRGEAGDMDPDCLEGFSSVAERREHELRCAAGVLGLAGVHFLDYRDSGMTGSADNHHPKALAAAPLAEVTARVVHFIRELRPQIVITFDPIGGYKHPDHIAVHRATVQAFQDAGDPGWQAPPNVSVDLPPYRPLKLYYHIFPKTMMRIVVRVMKLLGKDPTKLGRNRDIDLVELIRDGDFPVHARIDYSQVIEQKKSASECHESQLGGGPPRRGLIGLAWHQMARHEHFMRAYPPARNGLKERDLFHGVEGVIPPV